MSAICDWCLDQLCAVNTEYPQFSTVLRSYSLCSWSAIRRRISSISHWTAEQICRTNRYEYLHYTRLLADAPPFCRPDFDAGNTASARHCERGGIRSRRLQCCIAGRVILHALWCLVAGRGRQNAGLRLWQKGIEIIRRFLARQWVTDRLRWMLASRLAKHATNVCKQVTNRLDV